MIASRYASSLLLPRAQRQGLPEPGQVDSSGQQLPQPEAPGLPYLIVAEAALACASWFALPGTAAASSAPMPWKRRIARSPAI